MKLVLQAVIASLLLIVATVWFGGIRLVSVPSTSFSMAPATALVSGAHTFRLLDSPKGVCSRRLVPDADCEHVIITALAKQVVFRMPFSPWLHQLATGDLPTQATVLKGVALRI